MPLPRKEKSRSFVASLILVWGSGLFLSSLCSAAKLEGLDSKTYFGSGIFTQALNFSQHFKDPGEGNMAFFLKKHPEDETESQYSHSPPSPLTWQLGAVYSRTTFAPPLEGDSLVDDFWGGTLGLDWESTGLTDFSLVFFASTIPAENYLHGGTAFRFETDFYFHEPRSQKKIKKAQLESEEPNYDSKDAFQYYRHEHEESQKSSRKRPWYKLWGSEETPVDREEELPQEWETFPYLKMGLNLGFDHHAVFASGRIIRGAPLVSGYSDQVLNQYTYGSDLFFAWTPQWSFKVFANFYYYSSGVDSFLSQIQSGSSIRLLNVAAGDLSMFATQSLSLPNFYLAESVNWDFNDRNSISLGLSQIFYQSIQQSPSFSFNPLYTRDLNKRWRVGVGGSVILGGGLPMPWITGALELHYR